MPIPTTMNFAEKFQYLLQRLIPDYGVAEGKIITNMVLENISRQRSNENLQTTVEPEAEIKINQFLAQLLNHRPVQYVLNEAWFQNMKFYVDENVLIPRPETEELIEWIAAEEKGHAETILDIGSGSGCIPISLAKKLPRAILHSCDISEEALLVAQKNARDLNAGINWHHIDFLQSQHWHQLPVPDIIVSNPPYIPQIGAMQMDPHVVDYEPAIALFVPNENALVFYAAIAKFAQLHTKTGSRIFVEIHEDLADAVTTCFEKGGLLNIEVNQDMQGKDRMVRAVRP
jgi:release factor glutamine methyltransferase